MIHVFDTVSRRPRAATVLVPLLVRPICSCGWVGMFEALGVGEARRDWEKHFKVRAS